MRRLLVPVLLLCAAAAFAAAPPAVIVLSVDGAIGPATADYLHRGIDKARDQGAALVVLRMDTPGGLDKSMRAIIKDILASPVPVAAFVAPSGARAASAGTFILYASHLAAMAPGTNLGAATPVSLGGPPAMPDRPARGGKDEDKDKEAKRELDPAGAMNRKQLHDASAYIRGLAQLRGRNPEWAERAVREAVSLSAEEALRDKVIDVVARDVPELLKGLEGRKVNAAGAERTLAVAGAATLAIDPDWRTGFLSVISDPMVAYALMLLGIYALFFEITNPGLVLPGVAGAISLLVALYGLHMLPVNYAGLGLILLGIALMVAEAFVPAYGSLGVGGIVAFVIGSVILVDTDVPGYGIPLALVGGFAAASAAFLIGVAAVLAKSRRQAVVSGREELIGATGEVLEAGGGTTWARVHGELWQVTSREPLAVGQRVRVAKMDGLKLEVVRDSAKEA